MHTTPWYWATELDNVPAKNLVQVGIGGWQVPRPGVKEARKRETNVLTIEDMEKLGIEKTAEIALELAWDGVDAVYISFDIDSVDCGFVPGTGWPEPGGFLPREALKLLGLVVKEGICGLEVVEVSPPYDTSDITALLGTRVVVEALGTLVAHGKMGSHKSSIIDKTDELLTCTTMSRGSGGPGHNHPPDAAQWQTPHLPKGSEVQVDESRPGACRR